MVDALTTKASVKALSRSMSNAQAGDDSLLDTLILSVSKQVTEFLGREIIYKTGRVATFDVSQGMKRFWLLGYPDIAVTDVRFDTEGVFGSNTIVDPSNYTIDYESGAIAFKYPYQVEYPQALKVNYDGGYSADGENADAILTITPDIVLAVNKQVIIEFNKRMQGISSASIHGSSVSSDYATGNRGMASDVYDLLLPYKSSSLILRK